MLAAERGPFPWWQDSAFGRGLLAVTSRRLDLRRDLAHPVRDVISPLLSEGWSMRQCGPRSYIVWRDSALLRRSSLKLALFPDRSVAIREPARSIFMVFELRRRMMRRACAAAGRPAGVADREQVVRRMARSSARLVLGEAIDDHQAIGLLCEAELGILEAVCAHPLKDSPGARALVPAHLRAL